MICLLLLLAYWAVRSPRTAADQPPPERGLAAEPNARRVLRIAFGLLWVVDGILQARRGWSSDCRPW